MLDKWAIRLNSGIILFMGLLLSACINHWEVLTKNKDHYKPDIHRIEVNPTMACFMEATDIHTLYSLVARASPKQRFFWDNKKTNTHFKFISNKIFVNEKGEACRIYQVKLTRGFFRNSLLFNSTACRASEGNWRARIS